MLACRTPESIGANHGFSGKAFNKTLRQMMTTRGDLLSIFMNLINLEIEI